MSASLIETLDVRELEARLRRRVDRGEVTLGYARALLGEVERAAAGLMADAEAQRMRRLSVRGGRA